MIIPYFPVGKQPVLVEVADNIEPQELQNVMETLVGGRLESAAFMGYRVFGWEDASFEGKPQNRGAIWGDFIVMKPIWEQPQPEEPFWTSEMYTGLEIGEAVSLVGMVDLHLPLVTPIEEGPPEGTTLRLEPVKFESLNLPKPKKRW